jgi:hypothetical protein
MRAVWSFWSKPFKEYKGRIWHEPWHHWMAWGLSLRLASRYFPETVLVTDTEGKAMLVDQLGLSFTHVVTDLDRLRDMDTGWWALGKLAAYRLQDAPFLHLDTDVFLWKAPPASLLAAPVFAQCPERHALENAWCGPEEVVNLFQRYRLDLPFEWKWALARSSGWFREENCGIMGANRVDFIRYYSDLALDMAMNPVNAEAWRTIPDKSGYNMVLEQFQLAACIDFHRFHPSSLFRGLRIEYLFPSWEASYNEGIAGRAGYTHLLGDAKTHPDIAARLERRMAEIDPTFHRRCLRLGQVKSRPAQWIG